MTLVKMTVVRKTIAAALAALTMIGASATVTPASAKFKKGAIFGGIIGGLVLGALAARAAEGGGCTFSREAVTDEDGYVIGYRRVRYCD